MSLSGLVTKNFGLKLLAVVMAVVLWSMAVGREKAEVGLTVPLELVNFPQDMVVANQVPDGVNIRIRGSVALTRQVQNRRLRFSLDLAGAKEGSNNFTLLPDALALPRGVEVTRLAPGTITVELEALITKRMTLLPVIQGEPVTGYLIDEIRLEPTEVDIRGPEKLLNALTRLWTEPIDVTKMNASAVVLTKPALPDVSMSVLKPVDIKAHLKISEKIATRPFKDFPVEAERTSHAVEFRPKAVELLVRGPINTMSELAAGHGIRVTVNLEGLEPGRYRRPVEVAVPANMEVLKVKPDTVQVKILEELNQTNDD